MYKQREGREGERKGSREREKGGKVGNRERKGST